MSAAVQKRERSAWVVAGVFALCAAIALFVFRDALGAWFHAERSHERGLAMNSGGSAAPDSADTSANDIDHYTCSMHPSVHQHAPGKCPICGMDLVAVSKAEQRAGIVTIVPARQQLIGVRSEAVIDAPVLRSVRAIGRLAYDESSLSDVSLKVRGWIVKLRVNSTGQRVVKGEMLFELYSPELYSAQQDFLLALHGGQLAPSVRSASSDLLIAAARQRLRLLDLTDLQIAEIEKSGKPRENIAFSAPESGFVIEKEVVQGAAVEPGMRLYRIASLDKIWIEADVYEADFANIHVGQTATVTLDYQPGRSYAASINYVYPAIDPGTRTGRVRLALANKGLQLRPGMYATVQLQSQLSARLQVPASAVVYTGPRRLVFVDLGEGRFRPQEITIGEAANGMYTVLSGLAAGDRVVSSGVFLIAAEARIHTATKYWQDSTPGVIGVEQLHDEQPSEPAVRPLVAPRVKPPSAAAHQSARGVNALIYSCPMHSEVRSSKPGKCPKCGMDLQPLAITDSP